MIPWHASLRYAFLGFPEEGQLCAFGRVIGYGINCVIGHMIHCLVSPGLLEGVEAYEDSQA